MVTGQDVMRCGSCQSDMVLRDGRYVCPTCEYTSYTLDGLAGLLTAYRLATTAQEGVWSPIEQERLDHQAAVLAREIADMFAAQPDRAAVLV